MASKNIYYLRATKDHQPFYIQHFVEAARETYDTVKKSEIKYFGDETIRIQHFKAAEDGSHCLIHLAGYMPGDKTPTVTLDATTPEDDGGIQEPEEGREFQEGECYVLLSECNVLFVSHGLRVNKAERYLISMLKNSGILANEDFFTISPVAKIDQLELLKRHGVKAVQLETNAYRASLPKTDRETVLQKLSGAVYDQVHPYLFKDDDAETQKALEDMIVNVELRLDGNTRADIGAQECIVDLAESLYDDDGGAVSEFTIVTRKNEHITPSCIRMQKTCRVTVNNKTIYHQDIWHELAKYLGELRESGLLEQ